LFTMHLKMFLQAPALQTLKILKSLGIDLK
jgi:hypothetical protein